MSRKFIQRAVNTLSAVALIFGQFILPANVAFATANSPKDTPITTAWTSDPNGTKAYICKYVSSPENGFLDPQSGNNPIERDRTDSMYIGGPFNDAQASFVIGFGTPGGGQTGPTASDCPRIMTTLPAQPQSVDPCNLAGSVTQPYWIAPTNGAHYHWVLNADGSYSAVADTGYAFLKDGSFVYSIQFTLPADDGVQCQGVPVPPAPQQIDPCNPFDDVKPPYWIETPTDTAYYTWTYNAADGSYTVTAKPGYQLQINGEFVSSHTYYLNPDDPRNICYVTVPAPAKPMVVYECGLTSTATWTVPTDTDQVHWQMINNELWAYAKPNIVFDDDGTLTTAINFGAASAQVTYKACALGTPVTTFTEQCGIEQNDIVTPSYGAHYTTAVTWDGNTATVTYTADAGYVFDNGTDKLVVSHTDKNELCPVDLPTLEQKDPCNPFGEIAEPYWTTTPKNTSQYTWMHNSDGSYTATTAAGYTFDLGDGKTATSYTFTLKADDPTNVCYKVIEAPQPPTPVYTCGPVSQAFWMIPVDSDITWKNIDGHLWAYAPSGSVFNYHDELTDAIDFGLASANVEYQRCEIPTPKFDFAVKCGPQNDIVSATDGDNYSVKISDWVAGVKTITFTADKDYVFANGETTFSKTYTDNNTPCVAQYSTGYDYIDKCGTINDSLLLPEDSNQVAYSYKAVNGYFVVTVDAKTGFVLNSDGAITLSYQIKIGDPESPVCPVGVGNAGQITPAVVTTVSAPAQAIELPHTGPSDNNSAMTILGLVASLVTYGAVLALQRRSTT